MTFLDKAKELQDNIQHNLNHSNEILLNAVKEWNHIMEEVMSGNKNWHDNYN